MMIYDHRTYAILIMVRAPLEKASIEIGIPVIYSAVSYSI